ncbi:MAG: hypothetical protein H4O13_02765 [Xanthomonadales bacterium]|nr:hypothetical protein [Xanthomonadales bacterium]
MWTTPVLAFVLGLGAMQAGAQPPRLSPIDLSRMDVGCWYTQRIESEVFMLWLSVPLEFQGPSAFIGLDGEDLPLVPAPTATPGTEFRGERWRVRVLDGEEIKQDCGDECSGSLRRVQLELTGAGGNVHLFDAIERCGC